MKEKDERAGARPSSEEEEESAAAEAEAAEAAAAAAQQGPGVGDLLYALILELRKNTAVTAYSTLLAMDTKGVKVTSRDKSTMVPLLQGMLGPMFPPPPEPEPEPEPAEYGPGGGGEDEEGEEGRGDD